VALAALNLCRGGFPPFLFRRGVGPVQAPPGKLDWLVVVGAWEELDGRDGGDDFDCVVASSHILCFQIPGVAADF